MSQTIYVPVGYALTLTSPADSAGSYYNIGNPGDGPSEYATLNADSSVILGPFNSPKNYSFSADNGDLSASLSFSGAFTSSDESDKQDTISGASLTSATVAANDKVLIQDTSNSNNLKSVTAQSIADLVIDSVVADTKQDIVSGVSDTEIGYLDGVTSSIQTQLGTKADKGATVITPLDNDADGTEIATAVNGIITALIAAGILAIA